MPKIFKRVGVVKLKNMKGLGLKLSKYVFDSVYTDDNKSFFLMFSGRTAKNVRLSKKTYDLIHEGKFDELDSKAMDVLTSTKILVPDMEDEFKEVNKENLSLIEEQKKYRRENLYLSVQPSAYCQLACDYCGQEHCRKNINSENIDMVVDRIVRKMDACQYKSIEIGWFGGEPLYAWNEMRTINQRIKDQASARGIKYLSHITTNGYALTPAKYQELKDEFNCVRIEITLDGTKEFHDVHRYTVNHKGSFDRIYGNLINIVKSSSYDKEKCRINVRCNVDERNLEGVIPLLEMFNDEHLQDKIFFYSTCVVSWAHNGAGVEKAWKKMGKKTTEYLVYMIEHNFEAEILPNRTAPYMCIGTIPESEMYDAYGNIFDCSETAYSSVYANSQFDLGNLKDNPDLTIKRSVLNNVPQMLVEGKVERCRECKFYPLCGGLCPLALSEDQPRCPSFVYNIEDRMLIDMAYRTRKKHNVLS